MDSLNTRMHNGGIHDNEKAAIAALIPTLRALWPGTGITLFGSKVTGTADDESDLDLLILMPEEITSEIRKRVIHEVFEINLHYESNISPLILTQKEWNTGIMTVLPIHSIIEHEGVAL